MPVVLLCDLVPRPVRRLEVLENDPRFGIARLRIAPDIEITRARPWFCFARAPKPWMLVGCMIDHQLRDHPDPAIMRLAQKYLEVLERAVIRVNVRIVADIVTVIFKRRRIEGQQPESGHSEILQKIELLS